jgi:hypothetical protein
MDNRNIDKPSVYLCMVKIENFPDYSIDKQGVVYSHKYGKNKILKQQDHYKGYKVVTLVHGEIKKTMKVHRLVANAFLSNDLNKEQVNHIDGNKTNNRLNNLEWTTQSENQLHAHRTGLMDGKIKKSVDLFSKKVIDTTNGKVYASLKSACIENNLKYKSEFARMKYYNTSNFQQL